ncbi:hypothetical protein D3C73_278890 [compost metagenome]
MLAKTNELDKIYIEILSSTPEVQALNSSYKLGAANCCKIMHEAIVNIENKGTFSIKTDDIKKIIKHMMADEAEMKTYFNRLMK